jgi:cytochrome P450
MALYPDAQQKAQEEIDQIVGRDRLPDFSDQGNLPYLNALCKEVVRWQNVTPLCEFW